MKMEDSTYHNCDRLCIFHSKLDPPPLISASFGISCIEVHIDEVRFGLLSKICDFFGGAYSTKLVFVQTRLAWVYAIVSKQLGKLMEACEGFLLLLVKH